VKEKTYPLGVLDMYSKVNGLNELQIIEKCFNEWWVEKNKEKKELQRIIDNAKEYIELLEDAFIKGESIDYLLLDTERQILEGDEIPDITRKYLKDKIKSE
jgi:hypothetical protein